MNERLSDSIIWWQIKIIDFQRRQSDLNRWKQTNNQIDKFLFQESNSGAPR